MKYKFLTSIAMLYMGSTGISHAQNVESDRDAGTGSLDSLNAIHKGTGDQQNKDFDTGSYNVFIAASGAAAIETEDTYVYSGSGCLHETVDTGANFDVNVHLPDGHIINGFRYYYDDSSASSSIATLYQMDGRGGITLMNTVTSTGDTGYGSLYETLPDGDHVVNNANGAYVIRFSSNEVGSTQKVCGVRFQMFNN
jgi:hypothetical protein